MTLVTANNINNLKKLPLLLKSATSTHLKLFQVANRGKANSTKPEEYVSNIDFLSLYNYIKSTYPDLKVNNLMVEAPANYIIIDSTGLPKYIQDDKYIIVQDIHNLPFRENSFEKTSLGI